MDLERLYRKDLRLIGICAVVAAVSLFVGVKYFFRAFPEASIEFRTTKESSLPLAASFLAEAGIDPKGYRHASIFWFDEDAKVFIERELPVEERTKLLEGTVRLWRWRHRWFRPLQKEEFQVDVTTKGELVGFRHLLAEEAEGAALPAEEARRLAERFLTAAMGRPLEEMLFVEGSLHKRPHRIDHTFTWDRKSTRLNSSHSRASRMPSSA